MVIIEIYGNSIDGAATLETSTYGEQSLDAALLHYQANHAPCSSFVITVVMPVTHKDDYRHAKV